MLKYYTLMMLGLLLASVAIAQNGSGRTLARVTHPQPQPVRPLLHAFETSVPEATDIPSPTGEGQGGVVQPGVGYRDLEEVAGLTRWDAQWYGCGSQRIYANAEGEPVAHWLFSLQESGFSDRGTGRNVREGGSWPAVAQRVEAVRTGFPSATILGDGTEVIVSHNTSVTPFKLWIARKAPGATTWTESALPNPSGIRMLWPKIAVGGANQQTLHVIGITAPVGGATLGEVYRGLNGHILYYRSMDGGLSWDQQNVVIPGLDSSRYVGFGADSYTIDASGDGVAIAVFPDWNDVRVYKSVNNGDSWADIQVFDFPDAVENYRPLPGVMYTIDDIPLDTFAPDPLAIRTHDGFGAVLIDQNQEVHTWFGEMYVTDLAFTDTVSSFYPTINGLYHWKESFGANPEIITGAFDYDGDNQLTITNINEIASYNGANLSSFPTVGTDDDGTIYLVYAALHELYRTGTTADKDQFYRHLYAMKSTDGGITWGEALELTAEPYVIPDLAPFIECAYPAVPRHIGDQLWVLYQQDYLPGTNILDMNHTSQENSMTWVAVDKADIPQALVGTFERPQPDPAFALEIKPNPATTTARLSARMTGTAPARVEVFDVLGRSVQVMSLGTVAGQQSVDVGVQHLATGVYWVRVTEGARFGMTKLVVE